MGRWVRGLLDLTITTVGAESIVDLGSPLHNDGASRGKWTIVHAFYTLGTDSSVGTMAIWSLFVVNENLTPADFSESEPPADDPAIFLWLPSSQQKDVEIKAGRDIRYNEHVLSRMDISQSVSTNIYAAYQMYIVEQ